MAFALTKYLYPLESQIELSAHCSYFLDNPRSEEEIELVRSFVHKTLDRKDSESNSMPLIGRTSYSLDDLKEWQLSNEPNEYATKFIETNYHGTTIDYLCKIWIIIRFGYDE